MTFHFQWASRDCKTHLHQFWLMNRLLFYSFASFFSYFLSGLYFISFFLFKNFNHCIRLQLSMSIEAHQSSSQTRQKGLFKKKLQKTTHKNFTGKLLKLWWEAQFIFYSCCSLWLRPPIDMRLRFKQLQAERAVYRVSKQVHWSWICEQTASSVWGNLFFPQSPHVYSVQ